MLLSEIISSNCIVDLLQVSTRTRGSHRNSYLIFQLLNICLVECNASMVEPASPLENTTHPFLESDHALDHFFQQWQSGTLPKSSWTHAAHVAVAARLAFDHPPDRALDLTRFWSAIIGEAVRSGNFPS